MSIHRTLMGPKVPAAQEAYWLHPGEGDARGVVDELDTIKATAGKTGGLFGLKESLDKRGGGPPLHVHEREDEACHVLEGEITEKMADKVAVVTGGTTGIGLATVHRLLAAGCEVMIASRSRDRGQSVVTGLNTERVAFHQVDVTDETAVASLVDATLERFGRLDYLFNNAGVEGTVGPMAAWSADDVDAVLSVNVKGPFLCMRHAAPQMKEGSVIVNCSSLLATIPMPLAAPYAASKAALLSLTRSAAAELSERGIVVLAVCPGVVDTPMIDRVSVSTGAPKSFLAEMVCPSRQVTSPDRIAEVVATLLASPTSYESGSALRIGPDALERISP